jgi:hypothetical protein
MKHVKLFENFEEEQKKAYVNHDNKVNGIFIVDAWKDFDDNPLFYVWSEYPTYKEMKDGFLQYSYEFYTDDSGNKYFIVSDSESITEDEIREKINNHDWNYARNVDSFVNGADKEEYKNWLDLIS